MGQPKDFVLGFLMGLFLGIIMLFWLWEQGPYRQKMGIMSGVSCQLGMRYIKQSWDLRAKMEEEGGGDGSGLGEAPGMEEGPGGGLIPDSAHAAADPFSGSSSSDVGFGEVGDAGLFGDSGDAGDDLFGFQVG